MKVTILNFLDKSNFHLNIYSILFVLILFNDFFLSNLSIYGIQIKYLSYLASLLIFVKIRSFEKNFLIFLVLIIIFLIAHTYLVADFEKKNSFSIIFFISILSFVYNRFEWLDKNFIKINYLFFYVISTILIMILFYAILKNPSLFKSVGYLTNFSCSGLMINNLYFLFTENSHIGLILPVFFYSFLAYENKKINLRYGKILFLTFFLFFFSFTLLFTTIVGMILIIILNRVLFFKHKFFFIIIVAFIIYPLFNNNGCSLKFFQTFSKNEVFLNEFDKNDNKTSFEINSNTNTGSKNKEINTEFVNISSFVYIYHINLVKNAIIKNKLGYGFNNYEKLFFSEHPNQVNNLYSVYHVYTNLNYNDAASNFLKIIGEFGIFSIILILIFISFVFLNSVNPITKIILILLITGQLFRGAGYFNFGFLIYSSYIFILVFNNIFNIKKTNV